MSRSTAEPSSPSTILWSKDSDNVVTFRTASSPDTTHGMSRTWPNARIAASPGEAAILAFGQVRDAPWVHQGELAVRQVTTLSLSFDHRIVDGELGSAVLRDVGSMLEDPVRMLAWS